MSDMKMSAVELGFAPDWVADFLEKYGDDLLGVVIEAVRNGVSVATVMEVVEKFGPVVLQFLTDLLNRFRIFGVADSQVVDGPVVEGVNAALVETVLERFLPLILERYLPVLLEKYGDKIVQFIADAILRTLNK